MAWRGGAQVTSTGLSCARLERDPLDTLSADMEDQGPSKRQRVEEPDPAAPEPPHTPAEIAAQNIQHEIGEVRPLRSAASGTALPSFAPTGRTMALINVFHLIVSRCPPQTLCPCCQTGRL